MLRGKANLGGRRDENEVTTCFSNGQTARNYVTSIHLFFLLHSTFVSNNFLQKIAFCIPHPLFEKISGEKKSGCGCGIQETQKTPPAFIISLAFYQICLLYCRRIFIPRSWASKVNKNEDIQIIGR